MSKKPELKLVEDSTTDMMDLSSLVTESAKEVKQEKQARINALLQEYQQILQDLDAINAAMIKQDPKDRDSIRKNLYPKLDSNEQFQQLMQRMDEILSDPEVLEALVKEEVLAEAECIRALADDVVNDKTWSQLTKDTVTAYELGWLTQLERNYKGNICYTKVNAVRSYNGRIKTELGRLKNLIRKQPDVIVEEMKTQKKSSKKPSEPKKDK